MIIGLEPDCLDKAPGQNDLACPKCLSAMRKIVGQPRQGIVRVAHNVGSNPLSDLDAVDQSLSNDLREIGHSLAVNGTA